MVVQVQSLALIHVVFVVPALFLTWGINRIAKQGNIPLVHYLTREKMCLLSTPRVLEYIIRVRQALQLFEASIHRTIKRILVANVP